MIGETVDEPLLVQFREETADARHVIGHARDRREQQPGILVSPSAILTCWNRLFAPGNEIRSYVEGVVERHRLGPHVALGTEITEARWDRGRWHVTCDDGSVDEADVLVCATGVLHRPRIPDLPGLETFAGATFHSSRWDDEQLAGRRVAVIGTGSTGVQITGALAGVASKVTVFQRSRHWVMYAPNPRYTRAGKALARRLPALGRLG